MLFAVIATAASGPSRHLSATQQFGGHWCIADSGNPVHPADLWVHSLVKPRHRRPEDRAQAMRGMRSPALSHPIV
jgi:hypothetical protein